MASPHFLRSFSPYYYIFRLVFTHICLICVKYGQYIGETLCGLI